MRVGEAILCEFDIEPLEINYIESLVVFLYCGLDDDLLLFLVHLQLVDLQGVGQVADTPLVALQGVPPQEDRLSR